MDLTRLVEMIFRRVLMRLVNRGVDYFGFTPDRIVIFYQPHLELGLSDSELRSEIRVTVLHEMAHHLGIDDDRLHELGWD